MNNQPYGGYKQKKSDFVLIGFFVFCCIIFVLASLTLPIVILAYTENFKTEIICMQPKSNITVIPLPPSPQNSSNNTNTTFSPQITQTTFTAPAPKHTDLVDTIGIYKWLIVHGAIGIFEVVNVIIYFVSSFLTETNVGVCSWITSLCLMIMIALFRFSWLIVGAVMFWRDCPNLYPSQMNDLMWATLIIGFIGLWSTVGTSIGGKYNGASRAENNYKTSRAGVYRV